MRGLNALGIYRRHIEPMDLEAWDKAVRAGTADLAKLRLAVQRPALDPARLVYSARLRRSAIRCPTCRASPARSLVLTSKNTNMTDPARARTELAPLPAADFIELDAEHWIPTEQPEAMCRAIEDWISRKGLEKAL